MAKSKKEYAKIISRKKEIQQELVTQLTISLPGLKEILGDKKFASRIKKASKLLSEGIQEKISKKIKPGKKGTKQKEN